MRTLKALVITAAVIVGLPVPALARPVSTSRDWVEYGQQNGTPLTRQQVLCELEAARRNGSLRTSQRRRASTTAIPPAPQCASTIAP